MKNDIQVKGTKVENKQREVKDFSETLLAQIRQNPISRKPGLDNVRKSNNFIKRINWRKGYKSWGRNSNGRSRSNHTKIEDREWRIEGHNKDKESIY